MGEKERRVGTEKGEESAESEEAEEREERNVCNRRGSSHTLRIRRVSIEVQEYRSTVRNDGND